MRGLPTEIQINNKIYKIRNNGDYRIILDCFSLLNNAELEERYRIVAALIAFYEGLTLDNFSTFFESNVEKAVKEMFDFMECYQKQNPVHKNYVLYSWEDDEQLIFSAINEVAKYEVRNPDVYCHWFTFMGYFNQIGDGAFSTVISIRKKIVEREKLEKWEQKFKRENPHYFMWQYKTQEQQAREQEIMSLWNKKGGENK